MVSIFLRLADGPPYLFENLQEPPIQAEKQPVPPQHFGAASHSTRSSRLVIVKSP